MYQLERNKVASKSYLFFSNSCVTYATCNNFTKEKHYPDVYYKQQIT